ncbi:MAG: GGDEF domain-containing protein [Spirochaetales bacterium]|nr:GGDEF domain-containing protein [Spirochaetales bacterium]
MYFRIRDFQIPHEHDSLFISEQNAFNTRHMGNVITIMILMVGVLLIQNQIARNPQIEEYDHFYTIIYSLILTTGVLYLLLSRILKVSLSDRIRKSFFILFLYILTLLFMGLTYFDLHFGNELSGYLIILMFLSTMVWLKTKEFAFISTFVFFLLMLSYLIIHEFMNIGLHQIVQGTIYYCLAWVLHLSTSSVRIENFLNRITMEQQYEMLENESATDPLTGLYNRRSLKGEVQKELSRSERSGTFFCILILDIDHFKKVNDSYGHSTGDDVLKELSTILRNSVRLSDMVFRYGGEEFIILLPETLIDDAASLGERIREKVENYSFSGVRRTVTVSGGISQSMPDSSMDLLIQKADRRLYQAKKSGRNKIISSGSSEN